MYFIPICHLFRWKIERKTSLKSVSNRMRPQESSKLHDHNPRILVSSAPKKHFKKIQEKSVVIEKVKHNKRTAHPLRVNYQSHHSWYDLSFDEFQAWATRTCQRNPKQLGVPEPLTIPPVSCLVEMLRVFLDDEVDPREVLMWMNSASIEVYALSLTHLYI